MALLEKGDLDGAIEQFKSVTKLNPKHARAHANWGSALDRQKKFDEAIEHYKEAVRIDPNFAGAHFNWGNVLFIIKDYEGASRQFNRVLEINPKDDEARRRLQLCERRLAIPKEKPIPVRLTAQIVKIRGELTKNDPLDPRRNNFRKSYAVNLSAAKSYLIDVEAQFDTLLLIEDARFELLLLNDDVCPPANRNSRLLFTPQKDGRYIIVITSYKRYTTGGYALTIQEAEPIGKATTIRSALTNTCKMEAGKYYQIHNIPLTAKQSAVIELESAHFDTLLKLVDWKTKKRTLASNHNAAPGNNRVSRLDITPSRTGVYTLLVTSYRPGEKGSYKVKVRAFHPLGKRGVER